MKTALLALAAASSLAAADEPESRHALTIYSSAQPGGISLQNFQGVAPHQLRQQVPGYAMVRTERTIELEKGLSNIRFKEVAAGIDPTTVSFKSLTDPNGTRVLEQNYQFDLVSDRKILERYLDREVTVEQVLGDEYVKTTGTLVGFQGSLMLRDQQGGLRSIRNYSNLLFPELPGGLLSKPTLLWKLAADQGGKHKTRVSYQTTGMTWWADYNLTYAEDDGCKMDLGAWVSIINQSGATFDDTRLKLIAGDVNRVQQPSQRHDFARRELRTQMAEADAGFEEQAFFEYHLYTLGRPTDLPQNSTKQVELFPTAQEVACRKELVFDANSGPVYFYQPRTNRNDGVGVKGDVNVNIRFENKKAVGLGMPLPAGRVRVSQLNQDDGNLEFVGEDTIDHTPRNEALSIRVGNAFDVVGERIQTDFTVDTNNKTMTESIEIRIRNQKESAVDLIVRERPYRWSNWKIVEQSVDHRKLDAGTVEFDLSIEPEAEQVVRYTVRYSW